MRRVLTGLLLFVMNAAAWSGELCAGKITASILAYDRELRQGAGLLINHCGHSVRAEILVIALNSDGFPVARLRTDVQAGAAPISVFRIDLPFVQSVIALSGYSTEIAAIETLDILPGRTAVLVVQPATLPLL